MPPYLAGRDEEQEEFLKLLEQRTVLQNLVVTGLRGVGKTVLLDTFRPLAQRENWLWIGSDVNETASLSEENFAIRLLTDISAVTSSLVLETRGKKSIGFSAAVGSTTESLNYERLVEVYAATPGLVIDRLRATLEFIWTKLAAASPKQQCPQGIVFAYDEAQNFADHAATDQYPLSILLDLFQSLQRKKIPFLLVLAGLPPLFPTLVDARTYAERMFHVRFLERLTDDECRQAIVKPIEDAGCPHPLQAKLVNTIVKESGGYPYFVQFICREVYDAAIRNASNNRPLQVSVRDIVRKLDNDFFQGRWSKATDRQRELLQVIADVETANEEFTIQEIVSVSKQPPHRSFSPSHVAQMLAKLCTSGLVYKNRHGRYSFAVPLFADFIRRQSNQPRVS
jgi:hypothetical protein